MLNKDYVLGFTTDVGGSTSHTAIMARSLGIPAVLGLGDVSSRIQDGDYLIIDGSQGKIIINPDKEHKQPMRRRSSAQRAQRELAELPSSLHSHWTKRTKFPAISERRRISAAGLQTERTG